MLLPISFSAASSCAWRRPVMKTYAPSATNLFAVANPMPLFPPVITATLPSSFPPIVCSLRIGGKVTGRLYGTRIEKIRFVLHSTNRRVVNHAGLHLTRRRDTAEPIQVFCFPNFGGHA